MEGMMELRTETIGPVTKVFGHPEFFGNVKKVGRKWHAEVRSSNDTTTVYRFAGIWGTKREAVDEAMWVIGRL
jgi:hypothetical protein